MKIRLSPIDFRFPVFLPFFFSIVTVLQAQFPSIKFEHLTVEHGLSQSTCGSIAQDSLGFIWFGTQDGLNRYDGYSFKVYRAEQKSGNGLSNGHVYRLLVDHRGNLWAGTRFGLNLYDHETDTFVAFLNDPLDSTSLLSNEIISLLDDKYGRIWVGTRAGLSRFRHEDSSFTRYVYNPNDPNSLGDGAVYCMTKDNDGNLWIGTARGGLNKFNPKDGKFVRYMNDPMNKNSISGNDVGEVAIDPDGKLWMWVFGKGIDRFDPATEEWIHYPLKDIAGASQLNDIRYLLFFNDSTLTIGSDGAGLIFMNCRSGTFTAYKNNQIDPSSLSSNTVYALFKDNTGALWIGTGAGGVNKYDPRQKKFNYFQNNPDDKNSLNNNYVISVLKDKHQKVWIGTREGGLNVYDPETKKFKAYMNDPKNTRSIPANLVSALFEDSQGIIWIGTRGGLSRYEPRSDDFRNFQNDPKDPSTIGGNFVSSIAEDPAGNLWFGTINSGISKWERGTGIFTSWKHNKEDSTSLPDNFASTICPDKNGNIWIGTSTKGAIRFNPKTGKFTRYESAPNDSTRLSHNSVNAILQDRKGTVWIGTGAGLNKFNSDGTFTAFTTRNGFANEYINALREDSRGNLWMTTNKGLTRFDPEQKTAVSYFSSDGLPSDEFTFGTPWKTADGEMFFGNIKGAVYFHPENISTNEFIPPVVFTEFQKFYSPAVLEKDISRTDRIILNYSENIFSVSFSALNYLQSSKNRYAYKMEGFSDEWIPLGTRRTVTFTHLNPGEYTLLVKGSNNDGVWNERPASLAITIVPPFWRTWWFISGSSILIIGIIVAQVRLRIKRLTKEKEMQREFTHRLIDRQESERKRIANELHDSLGQNLLVIKNKLLLKQQEKTIETEQLGELSELVSGTIQEVRNISHHLRPHQLDQLGLTKTLRSLVKNLSESSSIEITSRIDDIDGLFTTDEEISFFRIIQESFNNILKHSGATKAAVSVVRNGTSFTVTVSDNGKGISSSEGFGISGMRERAKMFGWDFVIESKQGTQLTLRVSLKKV